MGWLRRLFRRPDGEGAGRDDGWIELPFFGPGGNMWAGELWANWRVRAPRQVDVGAFLGKRPLPYVWEDASYRQYVDGMDDVTTHLLWSWLYVFLHHRDEAVVCDALRQPELGLGGADGVIVADLVMLHRHPAVREEAVRATWRLTDDLVRQVVGVLRDDDELPRSERAPYASGAADRVLAAAPQDRSALADELRQTA